MVSRSSLIAAAIVSTQQSAAELLDQCSKELSVEIVQTERVHFQH